MQDVFVEGSFVSNERLKSNIESKTAKAKLFFDYSKLKKAIPYVWKNNVKESLRLEVPTVSISKREKEVNSLSSKIFYHILVTNKICVDESPSYWADLVDTDVNWKNIFHRNLKSIKENKLKQFNFKLLYNLIPTKRMLFLWKLSNYDTCETCNCKEDVVHAFVLCKNNIPFFERLIEMVGTVYKEDVKLDIHTLLKLYKESFMDDIFTIAFWSIYKMIILRNINGKDKRKKDLWFVFLKEIKIRMNINQELVRRRKRPIYNLPTSLQIYI